MLRGFIVKYTPTTMRCLIKCICMLLVFQDLLQGLADKGHDMVDYQSYIGVVQTIHRACGDPDASCIHAVGDGRKDGIPDGF